MSSKDDDDLTRVLDGWTPDGARIGATQRQDLPPDAEIRVGEPEIDWALAGEAVLLHEPGLRDFQLKELRALVEAEKLANCDRLNAAYKLPASGQPIERI